MTKINSFGGINNKKAPESLVTGKSQNSLKTALVAGVNVDITDGERVARRDGYELVLAGECHSLFSVGSRALIVVDGNLGLFDGVEVVPLLDVGTLPLCYAETGPDTIYFSNGLRVGVVSGGSAAFITEQAGTYERSPHYVDPNDDVDFYDSMVPGADFEYFGGRLWCAAKDALWYSEPFHPERVDRRHNYLPWAGATMIAAVDDGFYVSVGDAVWFVSGTDPKKMQPKKVCKEGAVVGTKLHVTADLFNLDGVTGQGVVWESSRGKILGLSQGYIVNLTEKAVSYATGERGASMMRLKNGMTQHLSTFANPSGDGSNMRTTDTAEAEVRRNGVII